MLHGDDVFASGDVPDTHGAIAAGGDEVLAILGQCDGTHGWRMMEGLADGLERFGIINEHRAVGIGGGVHGLLAIGTASVRKAQLLGRIVRPFDAGDEVLVEDIDEFAP